MAAKIDGTDGRQWSLPLPPLSATSIPEAYSPGTPYAKQSEGPGELPSCLLRLDGQLRTPGIMCQKSWSPSWGFSSKAFSLLLAGGG